MFPSQRRRSGGLGEDGATIQVGCLEVEVGRQVRMAFGEHLPGAGPPADSEMPGVAPEGGSPLPVTEPVTSRVTSRLDGTVGTHRPREGPQRFEQIGNACREPWRPLVVVGGTACSENPPASGSSGLLRDGGSLSPAPKTSVVLRQPLVPPHFLPAPPPKPSLQPVPVPQSCSTHKPGSQCGKYRYTGQEVGSRCPQT